MVFVAFALVTAAVQGALIVYARLRPENAATRLARIREWITRNQNVALAVVALALAVYLVGRGISGLQHDDASQPGSRAPRASHGMESFSLIAPAS